MRPQSDSGQFHAFCVVVRTSARGVDQSLVAAVRAIGDFVHSPSEASRREMVHRLTDLEAVVRRDGAAMETYPQVLKSLRVDSLTVASARALAERLRSVIAETHGIRIGS